MTTSRGDQCCDKTLWWVWISSSSWQKNSCTAFVFLLFSTFPRKLAWVSSCRFFFFFWGKIFLKNSLQHTWNNYQGRNSGNLSWKVVLFIWTAPCMRSHKVNPVDEPEAPWGVMVCGICTADTRGNLGDSVSDAVFDNKWCHISPLRFTYKAGFNRPLKLW